MIYLSTYWFLEVLSVLLSRAKNTNTKLLKAYLIFSKEGNMGNHFKIFSVCTITTNSEKPIFRAIVTTTRK